MEEKLEVFPSQASVCMRKLERADNVDDEQDDESEYL